MRWHGTHIRKGYWTSIPNRRAFCDEWAAEHNILYPHEWKRLANKQFAQNGGATVLCYYGNCLDTLLAAIYPEIPWNNLPIDWTNKEIQRRLCDEFATKKGINNRSQWLSTPVSQFKEFGGKDILDYYGDISDMLKALYPHKEWDSNDIILTKKRYNGYWINPVNQRKFLEKFARNHNITTPEQWYYITIDAFSEQGGAAILKQYNNDFCLMLNSIYSRNDRLENPFGDYQWSEKRVYFQDIRMQRKFVVPMTPQKSTHIKTTNFATKFNMQSPNDWYEPGMTYKLVKNGGKSLYHRYGESLLNILRAVYPETQWLKKTMSFGYWRDPANQKKFALEFMKKFNITSLDKWYTVQQNEFVGAGGAGALRYHNFSLPSLLQSLFPNFNWQPWLFVAIPRNFWENEGNVKEYVKWLEKKLHIENDSDWSRVTYMQLRQLGGFNALKKCKGVAGMLRIAYPDKDWETVIALGFLIVKVADLSRTIILISLFTFMTFSFVVSGTQLEEGSSKKTQNHLMQIIKNIFPDNTTMYFNYQHPEMRLSATHRKLQLDVFIPSLSLAFEYQGVHHYDDTGVFGGATPLQQTLDLEKKEDCRRLGITLILVPFWWDNQPESIIATVHKIRPDVFPSAPPHSFPISEIQPSNPRAIPIRRENYFVTVASEWTQQLHIKGWWMCELRDGVRAFWEGNNKLFRIRLQYGNGRSFLAEPPQWLKEQLPSSESLDGLLCCEEPLSFMEYLRQQAVAHHDAVTTKLRTHRYFNWNGVKYYILDCINPDALFEQRKNVLDQIPQRECVQVASYQRCDDISQVLAFLVACLRRGGSGVRLRQPSSYYLNSKLVAADVKPYTYEPAKVMIVDE